MATYGLSETGSGVTALPSAEALDHPGSAGRPLPGVRVTIEGPDDEGVGEIVVESTPGSAATWGSRDPPLATERSAPATSVASMTDGRLIVLDRRMDRIVRGGENIAPSEVEAVLLAHPAVGDAAVVGVGTHLGARAGRGDRARGGAPRSR